MEDNSEPMSKGIDGKYNNFLFEDVNFPCPSFDIFVCISDFFSNSVD